MKTKSYSRVAAALAAMTLLLGVSAAAYAQANPHDMIVANLKMIAQQAQHYYETGGHSSFVGFSISANDTGDANGSYSLYNGGSPPMGSTYVPGSTAPAGQASAQTLYLVGCGKVTGKDGVNPVKVYVTVTPKAVTVTDLN